MKLRIMLLIGLVGIGCLHAMEKEVTLDQKKQEKIDKLVSKGDIIELQRLLGPIASDEHKYALEQALIKDKLAIVAWLLDMGRDMGIINTRYANNNTPLHIAAEHDDTALVNLLLKHKANINAKNAYQKTPLDIAIAFHSDNVVKLLQEKLDQEARSVPVTPRPRYNIAPRK